MVYLLLALFSSLIASLWIVSRVPQDTNSWLYDTTLVGAQKFHTKPVPRVGGIAIYVALAISSLLMWWQGPFELRNVAALLLCATPAFAVGLLEDLTKRIEPRARMVAIGTSAFMAWAVLDVSINRVDIAGVDVLLTFALPAFLLTLFAVTGIVNAINIIDGFHGLALMVATLAFAAFGWVAHGTQDLLVLSICLASIGALLGLFIWNYPRGQIFLGDGGAYLVGFMLAQTGVLLFTRNSEVSAWFAVLVLGYPTTETVFSMYRKHVVRKISALHPDRAHLHMLVHGRVVTRATASGRPLSANERNARTSPYLWLLSLCSIAPALAFYDNAKALMVCCALFVLLYVWLYQRAVSFRMPALPFARKRAS